MNKEFDLLVFIGRFSPFHTQHKHVIDIALTKAKNVLVLVGSAGKARTVRNPFTFEERNRMIHDSFLAMDLDRDNDVDGVPTTSRIIIKPLYDKTYNDAAWISQVQHIVNTTALDVVNNFGFHNHGLDGAKIGLIGASKDHTSYYLKLFPQWDSVDVPIKSFMNATGIRESFLAGTTQRHEIIDNEVTPAVANFMFNEFKPSEHYKKLQRELGHVNKYKNAWKTAPYPVKHITVDAVVEQSGHILVVKRRSEPGRGLWAIPGGHLEEFERLEDGVIRELKEETGIKVPEDVLRGCIHKTHMFDDPHRSTIGRVITYAAHIKLADDVKLPKVKGADDAEKAIWLPIGDMKEDMFFDDHYHLVNFFLNI